MATRLPAARRTGLIESRVKDPARAVTRDRWQSAYNLLFMLLMTGIMTTGLFVEVGGTALYFERAISLLLTGMMLVSLAIDRRPNAGLVVLYLWLVWNVVLLLSMIATADPMRHFSSFMLALLPPAAAWLIIRHVRDQVFIGRVGLFFLVGSGIAGSIVVALQLAGIKPAFVVDYLGRLRLLTYEPNLFGSAIGFLILISLPAIRWRWKAMAVAVLVLVSFLASASKMPFLALAVCFVLYFLLRSVALQRDFSAAILMPALAASLLAIGVLAFSPTTVAGVYESTLERSDATSVRLFTYNLAWERFVDQPVLGNGPGDFRLLNTNLLARFGGESEDRNLWIGNVFLSVLHDSGIVGMLPYAAMLLFLLGRGWQCIRAGSLNHCGYVAGLVFLIICSQASTVHLNAVFGIAVGLVALGPTVIARRGSVPNRSAVPHRTRDAASSRRDRLAGV